MTMTTRATEPCRFGRRVGSMDRLELPGVTWRRVSPRLVWVEPGIWVVEDSPYAVYYSNDHYWRYVDGIWYQSPYYDDGSTNEGVFFMFAGSSVGPGTSATQSKGQDVASAYLGDALASAGDVNGDGYEDIAVGAPYVSNGSTNEGRISVFHGRSSGFECHGAVEPRPERAVGIGGRQADAQRARSFGQGRIDEVDTRVKRGPA